MQEQTNEYVDITLRALGGSCLGVFGMGCVWWSVQGQRIEVGGGHVKDPMVVRIHCPNTGKTAFLHRGTMFAPQKLVEDEILRILT